MKRLLLLGILFLNLQFVAAQSVLSQGEWVKIKVEKTGMHKISYANMRSVLSTLGVNIDTVDPQNIAIYGNGGNILPESNAAFRYEDLVENPIQIIGQEDGQFNASDYVLFYGEGTDTWTNHTELSAIEHKNPMYDDHTYYFISVKNSPALRVNTNAIDSGVSSSFNTFHDLQYKEIDQINLKGTGRMWIGDVMGITSERSYSFQFDDIVGQEVHYRMNGVLNNAKNSNIKFLANNSEIFTNSITFNSEYYNYNKNNIFNSNTNQVDFKVQFDNSANPSGLLYMNYLEIKAESNLAFYNEQKTFFNIKSYNRPGETLEYTIENATNLKVWNVSDLRNINEPQNIGTASQYKFKALGLENKRQKFVMFKNDDAFHSIEIVEKIKNQNLKGDLANTEYIILTNDILRSEADRLASFHNQNSGLITRVVNIDQVYNEFSSGQKDITAIRDFFRYLYKTYGKLKYALFFGDASYDYKGILDNQQNVIPTYQTENSSGLNSSYPSDDYFALLDDNEGAYLNSGTMDISLGRMPVYQLEDARIVVQKTIDYHHVRSYGDWRNRIVLVADDVDASWEKILQDTSENIIAKYLEENYQNYNLRKLYMDAYKQEITSTGERYPEVERLLENSVEQGAVIINYFGHGGETGWTQEKILTTQKIKDWKNYSSSSSSPVRLPLIVTLTCEFTRFDNLQAESAGESVLLSGQGGGIALVSTTREISPSFGQTFNVNLFENLLHLENGEYDRLGDVVRKTKSDASTISNHKVILFGDPAIRMALPKQKVFLTEVNDIPVANFTEPIKALDKVSLKGFVGEDQINTSFNGEINITIYDKEVDKKTLKNDVAYGDLLEFKERVNIIYKGKTKVVDGNFTFEFIVPQDIDYNIGNGRLSFYANSQTVDAAGVNDAIKIGGINPNPAVDNQGPVIGLYFNNINFVDGGITDEKPIILACLTDESGINSSGYAIGHDITGVIDQDIEGTHIMNDFYQGGENAPCSEVSLKDYQKGKVRYPLSDLTPGEHQLTFKAWDVYNNSSTETLDFLVAQDENLVIRKLLNWPNPFTDKTFFQFEHNCPTSLRVDVQIFTVTGKLVKTIQAIVSSEPTMEEGYRTDKLAVEWDGLDDYGDKIGKGVYIYKLTAKGVDGNICPSVAQKIEKLVILK